MEKLIINTRLLQRQEVLSRSLLFDSFNYDDFVDTGIIGICLDAWQGNLQDWLSSCKKIAKRNGYKLKYSDLYSDFNEYTFYSGVANNIKIIENIEHCEGITLAIDEFSTILVDSGIFLEDLTLAEIEKIYLLCCKDNRKGKQLHDIVSEIKALLLQWQVIN